MKVDKYDAGRKCFYSVDIDDLEKEYQSLGLTEEEIANKLDALNDNLCNSKFTYYSSLPGDVPIDYIHLQVRSNGSMYVNGYTRSFLQAIDFCRAVPTECETRCYGGRNQYPPMLPHNLMRTPEDWGDLLEEEGF